MTAKPAPTLLALSLAVVLAGCAQKDASAPAADAAKPADAPKAEYTIDESKLPPVNRFDIADLDTSKNACSDFAGYVDGKWLAANPVPSDRTTWGAFEMLDERSLGIRHQLAEQAAANKDASGVDKIVGDLYATGMDQAKIDAAGIAPIQGRLDAINAITDSASIADYMRTTTARGEGDIFGFGPSPDFKDSSMNIAYAFQGGLGLPDRGYYFDKDKADKLAAYQQHVAKVLELSGTPAADAAKQAKEVIAFETRLAKVSKSSEELSRDAELAYNPVTIAEADKLTPNFPWSKFFESQGLAQPKMF